MRLFVESSMLEWIEYDPKLNRLTISFRKSSEVYSYGNVSNFSFLELVDQNNDSVGKWMYKNIITKPEQHPFQKLPKEAFQK